MIRDQKGLISKVLLYFGNDSFIFLEWHYWGVLITTFLQYLLYGNPIGRIVCYVQNVKFIWFMM